MFESGSRYPDVFGFSSLQEGTMSAATMAKGASKSAIRETNLFWDGDRFKSYSVIKVMQS